MLKYTEATKKYTFESVCYIKNVVIRPNIIAGDYNLNDDINDF